MKWSPEEHRAIGFLHHQFNNGSDLFMPNGLMHYLESFSDTTEFSTTLLALQAEGLIAWIMDDGTLCDRPVKYVTTTKDGRLVSIRPGETFDHQLPEPDEAKAVQKPVVFRILPKIVSTYRTLRDPSACWSKNRTATEWRNLYDFSQSTLKRRIKKGKIRLKPGGTSKIFAVDVRDLPPGVVE